MAKNGYDGMDDRSVYGGQRYAACCCSDTNVQSYCVQEEIVNVLGSRQDWREEVSGGESEREHMQDDLGGWTADV